MSTLDLISLCAQEGSLAEGRLCLLQLHHARQMLAAHPAWTLDELATRRITDRPADVHPLLRRVGIALNDALLTKRALLTKQPYQRPDLVPRLRALEPLLTDTASAPAWCVAAWRQQGQTVVLRQWLPLWLDLVPDLHGHADTLRDCEDAELLGAWRAADAALDALPDQMGMVTRAAYGLSAHPSTQAAGRCVVEEFGAHGPAIADAAVMCMDHALGHAVARGEPLTVGRAITQTVTACQDLLLGLFEWMLYVGGELHRGR